MATRTRSVTKDCRVLSPDLGAGACDHLPFGTYAGDIYRAFLSFSMDWTDVVAVTSATLSLRGTDSYHVQRSLLTATVQQVTATWSEGSVGHPASTSNATVYPGPATTSTDQATGTAGTVVNGWYDFDITAIVRNWFNGQTNYGIRLIHGASANEFWAREKGSSYDAYISIVYTTNAVPSAPTSMLLDGNVNGTRVDLKDTSYLLEFTGVDPGETTMASYDVQIDTTSGNGVVPDWTALFIDLASQTSNISGQDVARTLTMTLARGQWYAMRVRTRDAIGQVGAWSSVFYFQGNQLPSVGTMVPSGGLAPIWNMDDLNTWTNGGSWAKPTLVFPITEPDGALLSAYRLKIWLDSAGAKGTQQYDTGKTSTGFNAGNLQLNAAFACVRGTRYRAALEVWDSLDESSGSVDSASHYGFAVEWGQGIYEWAAGSSSSQWDFVPGIDTNGDAVYLFRTATAAAGVGAGAWVNSIGALTPAAYLNVLVRLTPSASNSNPGLDQMTFTYLGTAATPDKWFVGSGNLGVALDTAVRRFGARSVKVTTIAGNGALEPFRAAGADGILCQPSTQYTFSCFVKTSGTLTTGVRLEVYKIDGTTLVASSPYVTATTGPEGWDRLTLTFTTPAGMYNARVRVKYGGSTAGQVFWVDAAMFEEGPVASTWRPGMIGDAMILDVQGLSVDASLGAIARFRGASGGARDFVDFGSHGWRFGGDIELWSSASGVVVLDGSLTDNDLVFRINADTGNVPKLEFGEEGTYDVNLYRPAADRLKTDDALEAASVAIGTNKVARFVAGNFGTPVSNAGTTTDTASTSVECTGVPSTGVIAVVVRARLRNTGGTSGSTLSVLHFDGTTALQLMAPAQNRDAQAQAIVGTGGTNSRQIKWLTSLGAQTCTYDIFVVGYWTTE